MLSEADRFAGRQAAPGLFGKALRDRGGGAGDGLLLAPGMEDAIGSNTQNIAFARESATIVGKISMRV
jgi:hypothetical protein